MAYSNMSRSTYASTLFFIITGLLFFTSCEKDTSLDKTPDKVNEWIYDTMKKNYLWADELPAYKETDVKPADFFNSLLSDKDGKHDANRNYFYSTIEEDLSTKSGSITTSYGLNPLYYPVQGNRIIARISYINYNSPAEKAGLKRNEWISHYNGIELTRNNYLDFHNYKGKMKLSIGQVEANNFVQTREVEVEAAEQMEINPIYIDTTFLVKNKKIAYLMYNSFTSGPTGHEDKTYDNQMQSVFASFAAQNPDEFILDLRYNGGGLLTSAQLLATMLAPQDALGKIFCKLIFNSKSHNNNSSVTLNKDLIGRGANLNLKRLYIITTEWTASSSELIINGLRPYLKDNLILVGDKTEGKNVGSNEFSDKSNHSWVLHPITCWVTNSEDFHEYSDGFQPNHYVDDAYYLNDLGTTDEYMLSQVLSIIETGSLRSTFRSIENTLRPLPQPSKGIHGIIIE